MVNGSQNKVLVKMKENNMCVCVVPWPTQNSFVFFMNTKELFATRSLCDPFLKTFCQSGEGANSFLVTLS